MFQKSTIWNKFTNKQENKEELTVTMKQRSKQNILTDCIDESEEVLKEELHSNGFSTQDLTIMKSSPRLSDPASTKSLSIDLLSIKSDRIKANLAHKRGQLTLSP